MRSDRPIPGNPWPHDMTITVDDRPTVLLELLWIREAYALVPNGDDLPPLLVATPEPAATVIDDETRRRWQGAWPRLWRDITAHAGRPQDPGLFDRLRETPNGSVERAAVLRELFGPNWGDEFGRDALDDPSYLRWNEEGFTAHVASRPDALDDHPERRDLDALVLAWRSGLTTVVTIPCRGEHTRSISPSALLVTDETRADSEAYRRALSSFEPKR